MTGEHSRIIDGASQVGVQLYARDAKGRELAQWGVANTDETGRFFLEHLPGSEMELRVNAKGYLHYEQDGIDVKLGQLIHVTMADGLRITGIVQTPDGVPITSYAVRANRLRGLPDPNVPRLDFNELMAKMRSGNLDEAAQSQLRDQMRSMRDRGSFSGGRRGDRGGDRGSDQGGRRRGRGRR